MDETNVSVLLVDDNPTFRNVAAKFLKTLPGLSVAGTAVGGLDGLAQAQALQPDLILVDLHMRDLDGLRLILNFVRYCLNKHHSVDPVGSQRFPVASRSQPGQMIS